MSRLMIALVGAAILAAQPYGGPATAEETERRNLTVFPSGVGLPPGRGNAIQGLKIYELRCVRCHHQRGEGKQGEYPPLVGGKGSLGTKTPKKTVGSYWPYATTLWDHINRAMPFNQPRSLPPNDVYAVTAYILFLNGIIGETEDMSQTSLPAVRMPNRDGFIVDPRPDIKARR
jgi:S-disulfanyl-L-cysteine oxidoreductase SoxD